MNYLNNLRIRTRLLLAVLIPVLFTAATVAWISVSQIQTNGEAELERLESSLLEARKAGLKNLIDAAKSVVLEAKDNPGFSEDEAKAAAS
ncbi:MAG: methyl-accepting chemotaxis protein, partial [Marinobacter sp.]